MSDKLILFKIEMFISIWFSLVFATYLDIEGYDFASAVFIVLCAVLSSVYFVFIRWI